MTKNLIFTGGSGLLAINWSIAVREQYAVILGIHERDIALHNVQTRQLDLESVDHLVDVFEACQPQAVIHTAGLTNVAECEVKPALARHVNVTLAANVAKACARLQLPLVHISTDHLFSGENKFVNEKEIVAPKNIYARTKAEAEVEVLKICPQALVIRTNFYGWGPSYRRSFSDVIIDALRSGNELTLYKDVFYTPILIEEMVKAVHDLISLEAEGIFHVVCDERISKYEFGLKIAKEFNLDPNIIHVGYLSDQVSLVHRPSDMSLSNHKICNLLGRKLGDVNEHIARLRQQEFSGLAQEIRNL